ncbi:hypothetical protein C8R44DRAFT_973144 [Mycena epipterygia]|nr:hypothetical protein C8R44DRAFT_973144 [Mycena epipterygia]
MAFTIQETAFSFYWSFAAAEIYEAMTELVLYGILLVLVAFAANLLFRRQLMAGSPVLAASTAIMFVLATTQLGARLQATVTAVQIFRLAVQGELAPQSTVAREAMSQYVNLNFAEDILLVTNNLVTDGVLIYRCFLIWGRNTRVIIAPSLMLLLTTILSYLSAYEGDYPKPGGPLVDLRVGFLLGVLTNLVLVGLTAGRIWYTRNKGRGLLKSDVLRRYNSATAMVLESGAIVCAWTLAYVVVRTLSPPTVWRIFRGGLAQMLNIVPTMIVVRVGLGHSMQETDTTQVGSQNDTHIGTWKSKEGSVSSESAV